MQLLGGWGSKSSSPSDVEGGGKAATGEGESASSWWDGAWSAEAEKDPWLPALSRKQRVQGFISCLVASAFCFALAFMLIPVLILKARKFAVLYTLGSVFGIGSFAFLWGPYSLLTHLVAVNTLPYTVACAVNMGATLYCGMKLHSTILTIVFAALQLASILYFVISYIPGGTTGLTFMAKICGKATTTVVGSVL